jgi:transcriptional regulator with XRE-family HTH domain
MKKANDMKEKIINQPSYWIEGINGYLYDAIVSYMEEHNMTRKDLADYLGISAGRVSQILNNGEINFSIQKLIEIALKIDKVPLFELQDKATFLRKNKRISQVQ